MSTMRAIKQLRKNLFLASNTTNAVTRSWKEKSVTTKTSSMTSSNMLGQLLQIDDDVRNALEGGRPVVALESTIVAHGMSFPDNLKLALDTEDILRSKVPVLCNDWKIRCLSFFLFFLIRFFMSCFLTFC